jgi:hypothetical protein
MTERLDMVAARHETWAPTIAIQWRLYPGADDPPLIDLADVDFEDEELTPATETAEARRVLRLFPEADPATLAALPSGLNEPEAGEADAFHWDAVVTYADATSERLIAGQVFLEPGVTQGGTS